MAAPRRLHATPALCLALIALLSHAPAQEPTPTRTLFVTVTDKQGSFVRGLGPGDFVVRDGKRRYAPAAASQPDAPATVGILLDTSGSMYNNRTWKRREEGLALVRDALSAFLDASHPDNEYFVVAFSRRPELLVDATTEREAVLAAVGHLAGERPRGATALYDALYFALARADLGRRQRRVILLITDGQDNLSSYSFGELRRAMAESDAAVYALGLVPLGDAFTPQLVTNLERLTEPTGGRALFPDRRTLRPTAEYLAAELRNQYALAVAPAPSEKGAGWHDLKVTVKERRDGSGRKVKFEARVRRGFYDEGARRAGATP